MERSVSHQLELRSAHTHDILIMTARAFRGFKAYKQIVKLEYKMGNHDNMLKSYKYAPH
jgi:hypothetical protein